MDFKLTLFALLSRIKCFKDIFILLSKYFITKNWIKLISWSTHKNKFDCLGLTIF